MCNKSPTVFALNYVSILKNSQTHFHYTGDFLCAWTGITMNKLRKNRDNGVFFASLVLTFI